MEFLITHSSKTFLVPSIILIVMLASLFLTSFIRKQKNTAAWRISYAKKWLKTFRGRAKRFSSSQRFSYIRSVDHFVFEEILLECFRGYGCETRRTAMTRDGGFDGFVKIKGEWIAIQAKRYSGPIKKQDVLAFENNIKKLVGVSKGIFIHTGKTSQPIKNLIRKSESLDLISGVDRVLALLDGQHIEVFSVPLPLANKTLLKIGESKNVYSRS